MSGLTSLRTICEHAHPKRSEARDSAVKKDADQIARKAWAEISDYLRTPLPAAALTEETVQAASEALV